MMIIDNKLLNVNSAIFVLATIAFLSGCTTTTTQSVQQCSSQEITGLTRLIEPTKLKLNSNQKRLTLLRMDISKERCNGIMFSPKNTSAKCEYLKKQEEKLVVENSSLRERLLEINAAIAGRPHAGKHVNSCKALWVPVRTVKKNAPKNTSAKMLSTKSNAVKLPKTAKVAKNPKVEATFIEDYVVPAYSPAKSRKTEPVAYTPSAQPLSQPPSYVAPASVAPPTERAYSDNAQVRVIGSSFFPDQSKLIGPPAPAHVPAP